jgi:hypothetical protein
MGCSFCVQRTTIERIAKDACADEQHRERLPAGKSLKTLPSRLGIDWHEDCIGPIDAIDAVARPIISSIVTPSPG